MGRPKKQKALRDKVITTKVTAHEYDVYSKLAEDMNLNLSIIVRLALIDYAEKVRKDGRYTKEEKETL